MPAIAFPRVFVVFVCFVVILLWVLCGAGCVFCFCVICWLCACRVLLVVECFICPFRVMLVFGW